MWDYDTDTLIVCRTNQGLIRKSHLRGVCKLVCASLFWHYSTLLTAPLQAADLNDWYNLKTDQISQADLLTQLITGDEQSACLYPAKTYLLAKAHNLDFETLISDCTELNEFREKVPFQQLTLVFASEEITSPASTMGHVFLQIDGVDKSGVEKSYALAYLTDLGTKNPLTLGYSILFSGRRGFVTLGATQREIAKYVDISKRTVWTVPIEIDAVQLTFMQLYIWELKLHTPDYLFIDFNLCYLHLPPS